MKKLTALQKLIEYVDELYDENNDRHDHTQSAIRIVLSKIDDKATELLETEREQIDEAWLNGVGAWDSEMQADKQACNVPNWKMPFPDDSRELDKFYIKWYDENKHQLKDEWDRPAVYDFASKYAKLNKQTCGFCVNKK